MQTTANNETPTGKLEKPWQGVVSYWGKDGKRQAPPAEDFSCGLVLVCEHASNQLTAPWDNLGITDEALASHVAWDPGALRLAHGLAATMAPLTGGVVLVHAPLSRLIYDLNRSPDRRDAMPERSEIHDIPGNRSLSLAQRMDRIRALYLPFHATVREEVARILAHNITPVLLTIHSFTPIYNGQPRKVELGVIHDHDDRLAQAIVAAASKSYLDVRLNEPYSAKDHVTHTLKLHATPYDLAHAMLEIRNDLLSTPEAEAEITEELTNILTVALHTLGVTPCPAS